MKRQLLLRNILGECYINKLGSRPYPIQILTLRKEVHKKEDNKKNILNDHGNWNDCKF